MHTLYALINSHLYNQLQARRDEYDTLSEVTAASYLQGQSDYTSFSTSFITQRRRYYELGLRLDLVTATASAVGVAGVGAVGQGSNGSSGGGGLSSQPPSYYK